MEKHGHSMCSVTDQVSAGAVFTHQMNIVLCGQSYSHVTHTFCPLSVIDCSLSDALGDYRN